MHTFNLSCITSLSIYLHIYLYIIYIFTYNRSYCSVIFLKNNLFLRYKMESFQIIVNQRYSFWFWILKLTLNLYSLCQSLLYLRVSNHYTNLRVKQTADISDVCERRDVRRYSTLSLTLCQLYRLTELYQCVPTEDARHEYLKDILSIVPICYAVA